MNATIIEDEGTPKYSQDGLFKIPRDRCDSGLSQAEQDYIIAQRTRSKVNLATTSIETLESSFFPPDIPKDLLYCDDPDDIDNDWIAFLNVPLSEFEFWVKLKIKFL